MTFQVFHRELEFRGLDESKRTAHFVASTENVVLTRNGPEVLRMAGADLKRYLRNPVVLDSHKRGSVEDVIGSAPETMVQGSRLNTSIRYSATRKGEVAWTLVKEGSVRAVSIGYAIDPESVRFLREGETDGEGEQLVRGPAMIANRWMLLEISNIPIPADEDALRREFYAGVEARNKEASMLLSGSPALGAMLGGNAATAPASTTPSPAAATTTTTPAPAPQVEQRQIIELPVERLRREATAICPRGLEQIVDDAILNGETLDVIRTKLKTEQARRFPAVGTPEPTTTPATGERGATPNPTTAALKAEDVLRAITGVRS